MSEEVKYCFYCGNKLNRKVKYCPGCGTHIDEDPSFEIKDAQSVQETSSTPQSTKPEPIQDEPSSMNSSTNNDIGLAVGAALLLGHRHGMRMHRRVQRHRRKLRRARMMQRRMLRNARMMRRSF